MHSDLDAATRRAQRTRRQDDDAFVALMAQERFRAFVWRLLVRAHVNETSFTADAALMAFREGERSVGLMLVRDLDRLCPHHHRTMAEEAARREASPQEDIDED